MGVRVREANVGMRLTLKHSLAPNPSHTLFLSRTSLPLLYRSLIDGFQTITNKKALVVYADSEELRSEWKAAILAVISRLNGTAEKREVSAKRRGSI